MQEKDFPTALSAQSRRQVIEKRRVSRSSDVDLGHGGQQQISNSSASVASSSGADRGGKGRDRSTHDGGTGRRRRQSKSLVAGGGLGTDSSEDIGAERKTREERFEGFGF